MAKNKFHNLPLSFKKYWLKEFKIKETKFYYGTVVSAVLICAIISFMVYYFGLISLAVIGIKHGFRWVVFLAMKLTVKVVLLTAVKRFFIDFIIMPVVKRHVFFHLLPAFIARLKHSKYTAIRWLAAVFGFVFVAVVAALSFIANGFALLQSFFALTAGKFITSFGLNTIFSIFAGIWAVVTKYWVLLKTTPLGMFLQVYIISFILDKIALLVPERAKRRLSPIKEYMKGLYQKTHSKMDMVFGFHLDGSMKNLALWLEPIEETKNRKHSRLAKLLSIKKAHLKTSQYYLKFQENKFSLKNLKHLVENKPKDITKE